MGPSIPLLLSRRLPATRRGSDQSESMVNAARRSPDFKLRNSFRAFVMSCSEPLSAATLRATVVGYTGETTENPTYEEVCTGRTGHAEVVEVDFDPAVVTYDQLLAAFWQTHVPSRVDFIC